MSGASLNPSEIVDLLHGDPVAVAPLLLGATLTRTTAEGSISVRLTEVEAYRGERDSDMPDPGAHTYRGQTPRNSAMYGPPGHLYVYFTYGMHYCGNLVARPAGLPGGILMRGAEVTAGAELALRRRSSARKPRDLARGPALLATCLQLTTADSGTALFTTEWDLAVPTPTADLSRAARALAARTPSAEVHHPASGTALGQETGVLFGPRVGVSGVAGTGEYPWRFWLKDEPTVSLFKPGRAPA